MLPAGSTLGRSRFWGQYQEHAVAFLVRRFFNNGQFTKIVDQPLKNLETEFFMCHFTTTKMNERFDLVLSIQEFLDILELELIIVLVNSGAKSFSAKS